jgi:hypothetical protein
MGQDVPSHETHLHGVDDTSSAGVGCDLPEQAERASQPAVALPADRPRAAVVTEHL